MKKKRTLQILFCFLSLFGSCSRSTSQKQTTIRFATLPILDSLPLYVAQEKKLFQEEKLNFQLIPVASGLERDQLMQSGKIEGMLNELSSTLLFNREKVKLQILTLAREAYPGTPLFRLLLAPGLDSRNMKAPAIGISENTVIEYVTTRLLEYNLIPAEQYTLKNVPAIPERFQLLMEGALQAATLPDPLAFAAIGAGAANWIDDSTYPGLSLSVISFSAEVIQKNPQAAGVFYRVWQQAVALINENPESFRQLLLTHIQVPEAVQKSFPIPLYPMQKFPNQSQWEDTAKWLKSKGMLQQTPDFNQALFLPVL